VPIASLCPVASASIRRTIPANRRFVRWLSADISQQYRACLTSLPPVFTSRCYKLVSDQFSIFFGRTKSRARKVALPDKWLIARPEHRTVAAPD
jgi:hypothetical protein